MSIGEQKPLLKKDVEGGLGSQAESFATGKANSAGLSLSSISMDTLRAIEEEWKVCPRRMVSQVEFIIKVVLATLAICYSLWCFDGCQLLLPLISDLGMQGLGRFVFLTGMIAAAVALGRLHVESVLMRHGVFQADGAGALVVGLNFVSLVLGVGFVAGVGGIGWFPWNNYFHAHSLCALGILFCGPLWALTNFYLSLSIVAVGERTVVPRSRMALARTLQVIVLLVSLTSLGVYYHELQVAFAESNFQELLSGANTDFEAYCRPNSVRMSANSLVTAAVFEWIFAFAMLGCVASLRLDIDIYDAIRRAMKEAPA